MCVVSFVVVVYIYCGLIALSIVYLKQWRKECLKQFHPMTHLIRHYKREKNYENDVNDDKLLAMNLYKILFHLFLFRNYIFRVFRLMLVQSLFVIFS